MGEEANESYFVTGGIANLSNFLGHGGGRGEARLQFFLIRSELVIGVFVKLPVL